MIRALAGVRGGRSSFRLWRYLAPLIAVVLLYLALRGMDWPGVSATIRHAHPLVLLAALPITSLSFLLRGLRWRVLLVAETGVGRLTSFWCVMIGYLCNNFLPARAGEVVRSLIMGRASGAGTSFVLATALTERIIDALALVLISLIALTQLSGIPDWLQTASRIMAAGALGAIILLVVASRSRDRLLRLAQRLPLGEGWQRRIDGILSRFLLGVQAFQHIGPAARFLGFTAVIWLLDASTAMIVACSFDLSLGLAQALLLLAALGLASAVPSTPGYAGIYQFVAVTILVPLGFTRDHALVFIVAFQVVMYAVVLFWAALGLWQMRAVVSDARYHGSEVDPEPEPMTQPTS